MKSRSLLNTGLDGTGVTRVWRSQADSCYDIIGDEAFRCKRYLINDYLLTFFGIPEKIFCGFSQWDFTGVNHNE